MGSGGHNAKPTQRHILEGTFRRDRHGRAPRVTPKAPRRPSWLCAEAKREWTRIVPQLERLGIVSELDRAALACYCQSWARYRQAEEIVTRKGPTMVSSKGNVLQRPEVSIARGYLENYKRLATELGLTPSARGKLSMPETMEDDGLLD